MRLFRRPLLHLVRCKRARSPNVVWPDLKSVSFPFFLPHATTSVPSKRFCSFSLFLSLALCYRFYVVLTGWFFSYFFFFTYAKIRASGVGVGLKQCLPARQRGPLSTLRHCRASFEILLSTAIRVGGGEIRIFSPLRPRPSRISRRRNRVEPPRRADGDRSLPPPRPTSNLYTCTCNLYVQHAISFGPPPCRSISSTASRHLQDRKHCQFRSEFSNDFSPSLFITPRILFRSFPARPPPAEGRGGQLPKG